MATNLAIDDNLLEEARIVGKHATKKAVVNEALAEYVQRRKQAEIINLFHKVEYDSDYDYKAQRKKR
ncbi:MAG TPA: type II toxin-antitoxin system VapB family antitoxin [Desulfuromonadaceae bacterium]|jgi:Arc/MetJ family transcription regulator